MKLLLETNNIEKYLEKNNIIDFDNSILVDLINTHFKQTNEEIELIKNIYEYVRDKILHSYDINANDVACTASQVFIKKHGNCCGKSHLLAALLRFNNIPTGFCYQRLMSSLDNNLLVVHGLNAVFIKSINKWIRLDARGNKSGINAKFDIDNEILAYYPKTQLGEYDDPIIYSFPNKKIIDALTLSNNIKELKEYWMKMGIKINKN